MFDSVSVRSKQSTVRAKLVVRVDSVNTRINSGQQRSNLVNGSQLKDPVMRFKQCENSVYIVIDFSYTRPDSIRY
ncbi:hypothetical protein HanIR_Chr14g0684981 [Helianthus annuus]|nr:hypothetical protein HanIR_Chr14g0684981 [Helianthus annuus]